jgi:hypothetical protein
MGDDIVTLKPAPPTDDQELVTDLCRFSEGLLTEKQVRKRHKLAESTWDAYGNDEELILKIENEKLRRIRDGSSKREKSQLLVVKAPDVLGKIMDDDSQSARHRIDSAKVLNDFAANGPGQNAPAADRFIITINLGSDTLRFNKSIEPNAGDIDPYNDVDTDVTSTPWGLVAAISTKKDDGGGQPL